MAAQGYYLLLSVCMLGFVYVETSSDSLSTLDLSFCYGGLEVIYPELDIDRCLVIPKEGNLREKLSIEWRDPQIFYPGANMNKTYVLVMVDPDAPSRSNPKAAYWRHWLVTDIQGESLKNGEVHGTTLTDYHPPTPSPMTGFHRYQFMVFEQPSDVMVSLTDEEKSSRGKHCNITNYTLSSQTTTALSACAVVVKTDHTTL